MSKNVTIEENGEEYDVLPVVAKELLELGIAHPCPAETGHPGLWHLAIDATWADVERVEAGL